MPLEVGTHIHIPLHGHKKFQETIHTLAKGWHVPDLKIKKTGYVIIYVAKSKLPVKHESTLHKQHNLLFALLIGLSHHHSHQL